MRPLSEIEIVQGNIAFELQEKLPEILSGDPGDIDGESFLDICINYRKLAICSLLSEGDTDFYFHHLYRSGQAYLSFLSSCRSGQVSDPYYLCISRAEPFWDSIAADDMSAAKQIASLSSDSWAEGEEYEDDFCYFLFLMKLLTVKENYDDQLGSILGRFEQILQEEESCRLTICRALYEGNAEDFNYCIEMLIEERSEKIKKERDSGLPSDPEMLETEAYIYLEGIALVRLAKLRNIEVQKEYKYIPSLAFVSMKSPFPKPESWKYID